MPLMWDGNAEVVELLVSSGATRGACSSGETWKVAALLKAGADPNARGYHYDFGSARGKTVLGCLLQLKRYPKIVELLRAAGADPNLG
jgi:hypothetical protein